MAVIQDIPVDVWLEICRNLSLKSLCRLQAVCKGFRVIVNNRAVWLSALIDLMAVKHSDCSREDVEKMSASELRDEAVRILRVDRAFRSPKLPHKKVTTPIEFGPSERIDVALLPRGERLLVIRKYGDLAIYDIATGAEIVSCLRPENSNLSEASHTDLYGLYPTSLHNGYIAVIATDHDADHGPEWEAESVISRELRVYKYSLHGLSHVLTDQQDPFDTGLCLHLSREEGTTSIRITRLYLPDPSNKRLIAVSTQTIDEGGHKEKETVHFWRSDHIPNESDCSLELLSPDFVLIRSERREGHGVMLLIDLARASKSTEPPAPLHPVDSGEIDSPWWLVGKCVVDNTSRRNPLLCSVRVLLLTPKRLYVLHITRTTSVGVTHMTLGFLPITTLLTVPEALVRMHGGLNHGLICMQRPPRRRPRRDPLEGEKYTRAGLWSYTIDYPQAQGNRIWSPGNMRLESTSRNFAPQILIGDRNEIIEAQSMEFRVDPVSGRFVQFAGLPSRRSTEQGMRKVDLYVLGDEMV